jgi:phosphomannomutase
MKELGSVVGGEGSGGVILPALHFGRDAMVGVGLLLQMLAEHGRTLSDLKSSLPQYSIAKGRIESHGMSPDSVLERIRQTANGSARINTDDGVRIDFPDHWVHLRKSNTEPIVRIIAEAHSPERASEIVHQYMANITSLSHE